MQHTYIPPKNQPLRMVFILGNSYSGSTLLGFLLTSDPGMVFLGEIKSNVRRDKQLCSCGQVIDECTFYRQYAATFRALKESAFKKIRYISPLRFIFRNTIKLDTETLSHVRELHSSITRRVADQYPDAAYWVDSSKSLWLLNAWLQVIPREEIKIVWIKRNLKSNIASFLKRGHAFFPSLLGAMLNKWLTAKFLSRNQLESLTVNYDHFHQHFQKEANTLSLFLKREIKLPTHDHHNHHATSGNSGTRKTFTYPFHGFRADTEWETVLSPWQKKITSWLD